MTWLGYNQAMRLVLIAHDIRSTHNVGALLRTAECMGVDHVYLTGYTPYPITMDDSRLPHIREKLSRQIHKTALDAENLVPWSAASNVRAVIDELRQNKFQIIALEQTIDSIPLTTFKMKSDTALLIGREVEGVDPALLELCDAAIEIPQFGKKESLNVVQATAIALYQLRCLT